MIFSFKALINTGTPAMSEMSTTINVQRRADNSPDGYLSAYT
jgi:hypothetical protein